MTSVGFSLVVLAVMTLAIFGDPQTSGNNAFERGALILILIGALFMSCGIAIWLWGVMP